jgi:hypothetical protein
MYRIVVSGYRGPAAARIDDAGQSRQRYRCEIEAGELKVATEALVPSA